MFVQLTPTPASTDTAADPGTADTQRHRRVLNELLDIGMDIARTLGAAAKTEAETTSDPVSPDADPDAQPGTQPGDRIRTAVRLAAAYDRVARAIRLTVLLARRLDEPAPRTAAQSRTDARRHIIRAVEDKIQFEAHGPGQRECLHNELLERLDSPELEDDLRHRPVGDIISEICRDLGLGALPSINGLPGLQLYRRRTPADIAALCARAAEPPPTRDATRPPAPQPGEPEPLFRFVPFLDTA